MGACAATPLVEEFAVEDRFVSGLGDIEEIGSGLFRLTFFVKKKSSYDGTTQQCVAVKVIMHKDSIRAMNLMIAEGTGSTRDICVLAHCAMH